MDRLFAAAKEPLTKAQKPSSLQRVALVVAHRFFPSHRQFVQRVPDAMPGDLEMPRPFLLRHIVMLFNMAAQRFPIQLAGIMAMNNCQKSWRYAATAHRYPIGYGVPILIWVLDSRNQL